MSILGSFLHLASPVGSGSADDEGQMQVPPWELLLSPGSARAGCLPWDPPGIPTCRSPPPVYFYLSLLVWEPLTPHPLCPGPGSSARQVGFPPGEVGIVGTALAAVAGGAESSWSVCSFYLISFAQRQDVRALVVCIWLRFSLNWKSQ